MKLYNLNGTEKAEIVEIVEQGTVGTDTYIKYADGRMEQELHIIYNVTFGQATVPYVVVDNTIPFIVPFVKIPSVIGTIENNIGVWVGGISTSKTKIDSFYLQCIVLTGLYVNICFKISGYWK